MNNIKRTNVFEDIKEYSDYSMNLIFSDPPYNLGSKWFIDTDGKYKIEKKSDFMNKWDGLDENDLDLFFKESFRILKYGGFCVLFSMDRQISPISYYAVKNGFEVQQSIYWYYTQNFPKATDVSKMIDKRFNKERKVVGKKTGRASKPMTDIRGGNITNGKPGAIDCSDITEPNHELAQKYEGYKYSVSPLKQVAETVLVFRKPIKNNSILDDVIEAETDNEISPSILDIDGGRVGKKEGDRFEYGVEGIPRKTGLVYGEQSGEHTYTGKEGRYPSQMFIQCICDEVIREGEDKEPFDYTNKKEYDVKGFIANIKPTSPSNYNDKHKKVIHTNPECPCAVLDRQSGDRKGWSSQNHNNFNMYGGNSLLSSVTERNGFYEGYNDNGGVSRVLHQIKYELDEFDLFFYNPKITGLERNEGLENLEKRDRVFNGKSDKQSTDIKDVEERFTTSPSANNHPTLKPIELINKISQLFKLPDECNQKVYVPFCGTFSEIIGFVKAGYNIDNIYGCELDEYYYEVGQLRLEYFSKKFKNKNLMEKFI